MDASETKIYYTILIVAVITGSIILYLIILLIRQHRSRLRLYQSKINTEITTLEIERSRMAADLHDELGPLLSAARFKLASIDVTGENRLILSEAEEHISSIIMRMRDISNDLMPVTLVRKGPVFAIEEFIHAVMPCHVDIQFFPRNVPVIPAQQAIHLYRIVQEMVQNTLNHSGASKMSVRLFYNKGVLKLSCKDNGRGFDIKSVARERSGRGLQNMLSRTEMLNGNMFLDTGCKKGTRITIEIPFDAEILIS
jgi:signal transduction histidine kinase